MPPNPHFMVKKMNVGEAPVQPIRRRRAKVDGYEALFLILWLITMVTSFCALLWWASTDSSLFGVVFSSDVEMRRLVFICCVSFWAFCSFSLLRFDALAKTREKIDFDQKMDRFHELDKRHIERMALEVDMSIDKIRGSTSSSADSIMEKTESPIENKKEYSEKPISSEE